MRMDQPFPLSMNGMLALIELLAERGALDEAQEQTTQAIALARASPMPPDEGRARWGTAIVLLRRGELAAAEREALIAQECLAIVPLEWAAVTATLAQIRLAQGRAADALAALQPVTPRFRAILTRLVHAEALHATGDLHGAHAAIVKARVRVTLTLPHGSTVEAPLGMDPCADT